MSKSLKQGRFVAVYAPNLTKAEIRVEIERLLSFCRTDDNGKGDHGTFLGEGPKIARVVSVSPDIYVGAMADFGPEESRPVATALLKDVVG